MAANRPTQADTRTHAHAHANLASIGVHFEIRLPDSTSKPSHLCRTTSTSPILSTSLFISRPPKHSFVFLHFLLLRTYYRRPRDTLSPFDGPSTTLLEDERGSLPALPPPFRLIGCTVYQRIPGQFQKYRRPENPTRPIARAKLCRIVPSATKTFVSIRHELSGLEESFRFRDLCRLIDFEGGQKTWSAWSSRYRPSTEPARGIWIPCLG